MEQLSWLMWDLIHQIVFDDQMELVNREYRDLYRWCDNKLTTVMIAEEYARSSYTWDRAIDWRAAAYNYRSLDSDIIIGDRTGDPIYHHWLVQSPDDLQMTEEVPEKITVCCQVSVLPDGY